MGCGRIRPWRSPEFFPRSPRSAKSVIRWKITRSSSGTSIWWVSWLRVWQSQGIPLATITNGAPFSTRWRAKSECNSEKCRGHIFAVGLRQPVEIEERGAAHQAFHALEGGVLRTGGGTGMIVFILLREEIVAVPRDRFDRRRSCRPAD